MKVLSVIRRQMALLLVATGVAGCTTTPDRAPGVLPTATADQVARLVEDRERTLIMAEVTSYYRDLSARDWDAFAAHFWRGATVTTIWEPDGESGRRVVFTSVPEFIAEADQEPGSKAIFEEHLGNAEVIVSGNLAVVWAEYRVRFGDPGDVLEWSGIDALTLMKHRGVWKISSIAFAPEYHGRP